MAYINWDLLFYVDPTTGESTVSTNPHAIGIPTYGNYWGANFAQHMLPGVPPTNFFGLPLTEAQLDATPSLLDDTLGDLDRAAYEHDVAWLHLTGYTLAGALTDLAYLNKAVALNPTDPEESLFAGLTTVGMIGSITLHGYGYLLLASPAKLVSAIKDAVHDIQYGLKNLPPAEQHLALSLIFEPAGLNEYVFDFAIKTKSFFQEYVEWNAMNALNAIIDGGEADNLLLNTGFPFYGTSHYALEYNAISGDIDLVSA